MHGPRGVGKLAFAVRFSALLLCEAKADNHPCGQCASCRWFRDGNHPDFRLLQPAALEPDMDAGADVEEAEEGAKKGKASAEILVGQVRGLSGFLYTVSHRGARRVALIHPAEALNASAANALLKALEEPPENAVFVLVSHNPSRLPATVRSRCVRIGLPLPAAGPAVAWLSSQGVPDPARWLSFAGGAPLLAAELATGERSADRLNLLQAIESGGEFSVTDRESLEMLAEALQKRAIDLAFAALAGRPKYAPHVQARPESGARWLSFARDMGRQRAMARRPLNAGLFGSELMARYRDLDNGDN